MYVCINFILFLLYSVINVFYCYFYFFEIISVHHNLFMKLTLLLGAGRLSCFTTCYKILPPFMTIIPLRDFYWQLIIIWIRMIYSNVSGLLFVLVSTAPALVTWARVFALGLRGCGKPGTPHYINSGLSWVRYQQLWSWLRR